MFVITACDSNLCMRLHLTFERLICGGSLLSIQRENQRLSYPGLVFLVVLWLVMIVPIGISTAGLLSWLSYLYIISYVKLGVTPIKYIPQVCHMNTFNQLHCNLRRIM